MNPADTQQVLGLKTGWASPGSSTRTCILKQGVRRAGLQYPLTHTKAKMECQAMPGKSLALAGACEIWVRQRAKWENLGNSPIGVTAPAGEHKFQAWLLGSLSRETPIAG